MRCENCGRENPRQARFCGKCGKPLAQQQPDSRMNGPLPPTQQEPVPRIRKQLFVLLTVLSVAAIALSIVILARLLTNSHLAVEEESQQAEPIESEVIDTQENKNNNSSNDDGKSVQSNDDEGVQGTKDSPNNTAPQTEQESNATWQDSTALATSFIRAWYDDWSLDGSQRTDNELSAQERCRSMVDASSKLYQQLGDSSLGKAAYSARTDAATCVVEEPVLVSPANNESDTATYRASIWYTSDAETNWSSSSSYEWLVQSRRHEVSWDVTVDALNKTVTALVIVPRGPYTLSGLAHSHEENTSSGNITVVSMTLDEPVYFKGEYKGTYEADAKEVALATSNSDAFATWSQYAGRRITVECDNLQAAYHDASSYGVDALATGDIRLVEADEPTGSDSETRPESQADCDATSADVVHLDGCDFIVPDVWRGKVTQGEHYGDIILDHNGTWMLAIRPCAPDDFLAPGPEVESYQRSDGTTVPIRSHDDFSYSAKVTHGDGKAFILYLYAYDENSVIFHDKTNDECREYLDLQAAVAGRSADDDSKELAVACLKACVECLRFVE